jgi:hypothetical protein
MVVFWEIIATLNFAFIDMIIAVIMSLIISNQTRYFKKSEYFVFWTIGGAIGLFFLSALFQNSIVIWLANLKGWLFIIFIVLFALSVLIIAKFELDRKLGFRLVLVPLVILIAIIVILGLYFGIHYFSSIK